MNFDELRYEETIDLKDLCIYILRKWRWLLAAIAAGALLLGGYQYVFGAKQPEAAPLSSSVQKQIDEHERNIDVTARKIIRIEASIEMRKEAIQSQKEALANYEMLLEEAKEMLTEELTQEARIELLTMITQLNDSIIAVQTKLHTTQADQYQLQDEVIYYTDEIALLKENIVQLGGDDGDVMTEPATVSMGSVLKFAILGAVVGGVVVCGIAFVQYFADRKLRRVDELKERYGLSILGDFYVPKHKNPVDALLDRLNGYRQQINVEQEAELIATKLQVLAPVSESCQCIMVTGTLQRQAMEQIGQYLQKHLPAAQYQVEVLANPVYDAGALLRTKGAVVVLTEAHGVSNKKEIASLMDTLQAGKARVLGVVLQ